MMEHTRRRGRKKAHRHPLSDIDAVASMRLLNQIRETNGWNESEARRQAEASVDIPSIRLLSEAELANAEFVYDPETFKKIRNVDLSLNHSHKWGIFLWMREIYGNELKTKIMEETLRQKESLLYSFNKLLGYDEFDTENASLMRGEYNVYRPFYRDPQNKILVRRLEVGSAESAFDCRLYAEYSSVPSVTIRDDFKGKIVPQGGKMVAVFQVPKPSKGMILIHFDMLDASPGIMHTMSGLMVTAIGDGRSSAWPTFALRVDDGAEVSPSLITRDQMSQLPPEALEIMERGAVHWNVNHYPKPSNN